MNQLENQKPSAKVSLADVKYMSVQNTLYQARLEGREYRSQLSEDKSSVIVERIS